jgi:hypothetical protein
VDNVLVVHSLEKSHIAQWETEALEVVAVKDSIPYVHGLWDGEEFHAPTTEYLKSIGLVRDLAEQVEAE